MNMVPKKLLSQTMAGYYSNLRFFGEDIHKILWKN